MCVIVIFLILKTFFFLRIFSNLTPIVVMLTNVIYDLRIFLFFYIILVFLFSQMYTVLGLGIVNQPMPDKEAFIDAEPNSEYKAVGMFVGQFMWTLRFSMGDFSGIGASIFLGKEENYIFWIIWSLTVGITCIVFLNFIVAEASASYTKVTETLEAVIWMEKSAMISESEEMTFNSFKTQDKSPKYIIVRQTED